MLLNGTAKIRSSVSIKAPIVAPFVTNKIFFLMKCCFCAVQLYCFWFVGSNYSFVIWLYDNRHKINIQVITLLTFLTHILTKNKNKPLPTNDILGITIDQKLNWLSHINMTAIRADQTLGILWQMFNLDTPHLFNHYKVQNSSFTKKTQHRPE